MENLNDSLQKIHEKAVKDWWELDDNFKKWSGKTYEAEYRDYLHYLVRKEKILHLKKKIKLDKQARILELGFGGGELAGDILNMGYEYYGIDISEKFCQRATLKYKNYVIDKKAKFIEASLEKEYPFEENFFDLVITSGSIHYAGNISNAIKEIKRVLKPNRNFIIAQGNMYTLNDLIFFRKLLKCLVWFFTKENFMHSYSYSFKDIIMESKLSKFFKKYENSKFMNSGFMVKNQNKWKYKISKRLFSYSKIKNLVDKNNFETIEVLGGPFLYNGDKNSSLKKKVNLILQRLLDDKVLPFLIRFSDNIILLCKVKKG